jgi:glutaredoxin-like protein NrdH
MAAQKPNVKLYSLSTCGHCNQVKKFLSDINVAFEYQDLDLLARDERDNILSDMRRFNPLCTLPTLVIGDAVIIGFDEAQIRRALGI